MKRLALLLFVGLMPAAILACGKPTPDQTIEGTQVASVPTATSLPISTSVSAAASQPTEEPAPTAAPTATPVPAPTAAAAPTLTPIPASTAAPVPTSTTVPAPTAAPAPTSAPVPTATSAPTAAPAPTATPAPTTASQSAIAATLAPLGDNLRFVATVDTETQRWLIYDSTGDFTPEDIYLFSHKGTPPASEIGVLTELKTGWFYIFVVNENQTVELGGISYTFYRGSNPIAWR